MTTGNPSFHLHISVGQRDGENIVKYGTQPHKIN